MKKLLILTILVIFQICSITVALSQSSAKGTIKGKIVDAKNGESLPSVNVSIKGTYYGGVSDPDGNVTITNINPGTYNLEVSLLGYKSVQYTSFKVVGGETATLNVKMEETVLSIGKEVVIIGEKPLFNIEETQSTRSINSEDIKVAAVQTVQDVVAMQAGVVQSDNEIHIRGGRTYENSYLLDGISVQDNLGGTGFGLQLSPAAIQEVEVITGGYNAEYGQATSGVVNITTKEGTKTFSGSTSYKRDHFGFNQNSRSNANTDIFDLSLSGPEPISTYFLPSIGLPVPGTVSFFGTFYANFSDGYTRWVESTQNGKPNGYQVRVPNQLHSSLLGSGYDWMAPRRSNNWSWMTKLTWRPSAIDKVSYGYSSSIVIDQNSQTVQATLEHVEPNPGYQFEFQEIPDSANTFTQRNIQHTLSYTHTLSAKAFYELKYSLYTAHVRGDANGTSYEYYHEPKDIITFPIQYYNLNSDTIGVIPGDGFYDIGNPTRWRDHYMLENTFKGDFTNNFTEKHKFKTGVEVRFQSLQMVDLVSPWYKPLGLNYDIYQVDPAQGALYAQDNIVLKGMILNFGLRFDYWFPGKYVDETMKMPVDSINVSKEIKNAYFNDTYNLFGRRWKGRLSPRLGISHPVSDNQTLFFSYGHFSKLPRPQFVYSKLRKTNAKATYQTIGNPDLNPETTVSYELGIRNQLSESYIVSLTAYYKDIFDYITARSVQTTQTRYSGGSYTTYVNQDYSRVRGVEMEFKGRISDWLRLTFSGSYSRTTGKSSNADDAAYNLQQGLEENIKETPMSFDRPLQLSLNLNFNCKKNEPFFGFGKGILDDYNLYVRFFYQSGKRYTQQNFLGYDKTSLSTVFYDTLGRPLYIADYQNPYGELSDPWFYIDLNFEKYFDVSIGKLSFKIEIQNLLNRSNSQIINPVTGKAYSYGDHTLQSVNDPLYPDLTSPVNPYPYNPARYLTPRTYRLGLEFRF
jgi:outer membrane receptor protein involved in Fe transport